MPRKSSDADGTPTPSDPVARFEEAMQELELIVQKMEAGDLRLEESLQFFERGMLLSKQCRESLDAAELRIKSLLDVSASE